MFLTVAVTLVVSSLIIHDSISSYLSFRELAIGLKDYLRKAAKWKKKAETSEPVFNRLEQLREAIRLRIEASQRRGST